MKAFKIVCISFFIVFMVYAQVSVNNARLSPRLLNYQGYLTDTLGVPISGNLDMTFSIYDQESDGNLLWTEDSSDVPVEKGVFNVLLGSNTAIPDSVFADFSNCWLELMLTGTQTLAPRTRITSVGYAFTATYSDTAKYAHDAPSDGVPSGYSILGETPSTPGNYSYTGTYVIAIDSGITPDSWVTKTAMPIARRGYAIAEVDGKIYVMGGYTGSGATAVVEEYDPVSNTWSTKADMPTARYYLCAAAVNGKIYAIGGYNGATLNTVEEYDPSYDTWTTKTPMPTARYYLTAIAVNGKIYAMGGGGTQWVNEEYDVTGDSWSSKAAPPGPLDGHGAAAVNGTIHAIGGNPVHYAYDPVTNSWTTKANMPTGRAYHAVVALYGKIYAIGGNVGAGSYTNVNEVYDPKYNSWTTKTPMPTARCYIKGVAANGRIYIIGGYNGSTLNVNEAYGPGERLWYVHRKN